MLPEAEMNKIQRGINHSTMAIVVRGFTKREREVWRRVEMS